MAKRAYGSGQIRERLDKDGQLTFAIRYPSPKGRVLETLGKAPEWDRTKAEQELKLRRAQIDAGVWQPPRPEPGGAITTGEVPSFWAFAERWFEQKELEVGERTREHVLYLLNQHLAWFGHYRVDEITEELIDEYRAFKLREGKLSAGTINKTLRLLARILDKAVRRATSSGTPRVERTVG